MEMFFISLSLCLLSTGFVYILSQNRKLKVQILLISDQISKLHDEIALNQEVALQAKIRPLDEKATKIEAAIMVVLDDVIKKRQAEKEESRLPPANRKPRTEEQKRKASQIKKQWWEQQRKSQGAISEIAPQEPISLNLPAPVQTQS